jgi:F-type H+-transporting ATPase subunit epsilon
MNAMSHYLVVNIVSLEKNIFSDQVSYLVVPGILGELGIHPGHTQLLTSVKPGSVRLVKDSEEEVLYISGGILEVQPDVVSLLADTAVRAADLDESLALEAKRRAESMLQVKRSDIDYAQVMRELTQAVAQLRTINQIKKKLQGH